MSGTIALSQQFVDANAAEKLLSVVNSPIVPAGRQLSTTLVDQGSQAGDLLGITLLRDKNPAVPAVDDTQRDTVLATLRDTGFITYGSERIGVADAAVIVTGGDLGRRRWQPGRDGRALRRRAGAARRGHRRRRT